MAWLMTLPFKSLVGVRINTPLQFSQLSVFLYTHTFTHSHSNTHTHTHSILLLLLLFHFLLLLLSTTYITISYLASRMTFTVAFLCLAVLNNLQLTTHCQNLVFRNSILFFLTFSISCCRERNAVVFLLTPTTSSLTGNVLLHVYGPMYDRGMRLQ